MSTFDSHSPTQDSSAVANPKQMEATAPQIKAHAALAPDGLPWPKGYFDRTPRQSLEEAIAMYGVRPSEYWKGWPCYTPEDAARPEYKGTFPDEPIELQEQWRKEEAEWEASGRKGAYPTNP